MISLKSISKQYAKKDRFIFEDVNLTFSDNSLNLIIGPSGSGKTTLLNIIGGLDYPTNGSLFYNEKEITKKDLDGYRNSLVSFVFQKSNLINVFTIEENLKIAFDLAGKKYNKNDVEAILNKVGLPDEDDINTFLKKKPNQLSVGQVQRVTIARALIKDPSILIFDEPTSALDDDNSLNILSLLKGLSKEKTIIISSHNTQLFINEVDQIIEIKSQKVKIIKESVNNLAKEDKRSFKKGFFSFLETLKIALINLKNKKVRLVTSLIISLLTTTLFGTVFMLQNSDLNSVVLRTQIDNDNSDAFITNIEKYKDHSSSFEQYKSSKFTNEQINSINEYTDGINSPYRELYVDNFFALSAEKDAYVSTFLSSNAIEIPTEKENEFGITRYSKLKDSTISKLPTNANEVAISSLMAEFFKIYGLITSIDEENYEFTISKVDTIDELIGKTISNGMVITGIYATPDNMLETLTPYLELNNDDAKLMSNYKYVDYLRNSKTLSQCFFVSKGYFKEVFSESISFSSYYLKIKGNYKSDINFLRTLNSSNTFVELSNQFIGFTYYSELLSNNTVSVVLRAIIWVLIIISLALSLNLFYANVKAMEKDLGIFKSMGASKLSISLIVTSQTLIIAFFNLILSLIILGIISLVINKLTYISFAKANIFM